MNFVEAMKAMLDGKKIRNVEWGEGEFIFIEDNKVLDEEGCDPFITIGNKYMYELYQEPQEQLFQWVTRVNPSDCWQISPFLRTEKQAAEQFIISEYKKLNDVLGVK